MPRIEFDGIGEPIPTIALPPFGVGTLPPTVLTFTENADFSASVYKDLGFTHFEVWCVGAAGGRGGDPTTATLSVEEDIWRPVPQDVWNLRLELIRLYDYMNRGAWDTAWIPAPGVEPIGSVMWTAAQMEEWQNPSHMLNFVTYRQIVLFPQVQGMGGGGGGGGMHKVAGLLETLPEVVPIVVGKAGADAGYGQAIQPTPLDKNPLPVPLAADPRGWPWSRVNEVSNYLSSYTHSYPAPHTILDPVRNGQDGGYSAFADLAQASGGRGGVAGQVWDGAKFVVDGRGGEGGLGGRILSGGGGAGSIAEGTNGADGIWRPETGIGGGGGGGKGGRATEHLGGGGIGGGGFGPITTITHLATAGGQGSYSFADTTVYGQRQTRQAWTYLKPTPNYWSIPEPGVVPHNGNWPNGTVTYTPVSDPQLVVPGGGGGARPMKNLKVGSRATGYSPNGVVVLRLTRIT